MWPALRITLNLFSPGDPFAVYLVACEHGSLEEAKEAAMLSTPRSYTRRDYGKETRYTSDRDIFRFIRFVQSREDVGRSIIRDIHKWPPLSRVSECGDGYEHWSNAMGFCIPLATMVEERFIHKPCLEIWDLLALPHGISDARNGCERGSGVVESYQGFSAGQGQHLCLLSRLGTVWRVSFMS